MKKLFYLIFMALLPGISHGQAVNSLKSVNQELLSSNLPIVIINTFQGEQIPDPYKITADMKIIWNGGTKRNFITDSGNVYTGKIGIEIRGAYSASLPQKPYSLETRDVNGAALNVSILGMPSENDWILTANYNDKTFLRNYLAFEIFRKMGHYAPRTRFCEVVINGEYQGIYLLGEKIKQDKGRVDIAELKPRDDTGDEVTGGYIIKNDYYSDGDSWASHFSPVNRQGATVHFVYFDPKPADIAQPQKDYIKDFINTLETVLYNPSFSAPVFGYKSYLDVNSFADYFILSEVTRNVDAYKKSRYFFKNRDSRGGLLFSGPPWDYDWAWKTLTENCIHFNKTDGSGWAYKINECYADPVPPSWEVRMMQDPEFVRMIHNRYFELRSSYLSQSWIESTIDSVTNLLDEAQVRHYQKWPILGVNVGTPEPDFQPDTYKGDINKFKSWINTRLTWLDANMPGIDVSVRDIKSGEVRCRLFPNPFDDLIYIEADREIEEIAVIDVSGTVVRELTALCSFSVRADLSGIKTGLYIVKIRLNNDEVIVNKIIKK